MTNRIYSKAQMRAVEDFAAAVIRNYHSTQNEVSVTLARFKAEQEKLRPAKVPKAIAGRMSTLSLSVRRQLEDDPFMQHCIYRWIDLAHVCEKDPVTGKLPQWEHPWIYGKTKVQERWAVVPLCWRKHQGGELVKDVGRLVSLMRMTLQERFDAERDYPRTDWERELGRLAQKYPDIATAYGEIESWLAKQEQN